MSRRPLVSVVLPTVRGREDLLERTTASLLETVPKGRLEMIVLRDRPFLNLAWGEGAGMASGEYVCCAADDVLFHDGWLEAAKAQADRGFYPSPRILHPDGVSLHSCGTMGAGVLMPECPDGTVCGTSPFPFAGADDMRVIAGDPIPVHYYGDDWFAWRARAMCHLQPTVCRGFLLTHLEGKVARHIGATRWQTDKDRYLRAVSEAAAVPA